MSSKREMLAIPKFLLLLSKRRNNKHSIYSIYSTPHWVCKQQIALFLVEHSVELGFYNPILLHGICIGIIHSANARQKEKDKWCLVLLFLLYFEDISAIIPTENMNRRKKITYRNKREKNSQLQKGLGNFNIPYLCLNVILTE